MALCLVPLSAKTKHLTQGSPFAQVGRSGFDFLNQLLTGLRQFPRFDQFRCRHEKNPLFE
jgi:hypothetical protein